MKWQNPMLTQTQKPLLLIWPNVKICFLSHLKFGIPSIIRFTYWGKNPWTPSSESLAVCGWQVWVWVSLQPQVTAESHRLDPLHSDDLASPWPFFPVLDHEHINNIRRLITALFSFFLSTELSQSYESYWV